MKRFLSILSIGIILLLAAYLLWLHFRTEDDIPKSNIIGLIPENSALLLKCSSIKKLYELIERDDKSIWGKEISPYQKLGTFTTEELCKYLLPLDTLHSLGVDTESEFGITLNEVKAGFEQASSSATIFIPIVEKESFITLYNARTDKPLKKVHDPSREFTYYELSDSTDDFIRYCMFKENYLWIVIGATRGACELTLDRLQDGKKLSESKTYLKLEKQLSTNRDLMIYTNYRKSPEIRGLFLGFLQTVIENFEQSIAAPLGAQLLNIEKHAGLYSFHINNGTLHGETSFLPDSIERGNPITPISEPSEKISISPLMLSSFNLDLTNQLRSFDSMLLYNNTNDTTYRHQFFSDLAPILGKRVHLSFHDAEKISLKRLNAVLSLEVTDTVKADSIFTHYLDLEASVDTIPFTKIDYNGSSLFKLILLDYELYITLYKNRVLVTSEPGYLPILTEKETPPIEQESIASSLSTLTPKGSDAYLVVELENLQSLLQNLQQTQGIQLTMPTQLKRLILSQYTSEDRVVTRFSLSSSYRSSYLRSIVNGLSSTKATP